jgi:hypothetical protein
LWRNYPLLTESANPLPRSHASATVPHPQPAQSNLLQMNPVRIITPYFIKTSLNIFFHLLLYIVHGTLPFTSPD